MGAFELKGFSQASGAVFFIERFVSYMFYFHNFDREGPGGADVYILYESTGNKLLPVGDF